MLCPVCGGRRESAPGQGCGACHATGFIPGLTSEAVHGIAVLIAGAANIRVPVPEDSIILLTIQQARGAHVGMPYISEQDHTGFTISSLAGPEDKSTVGWLIIG